MRNIAALNSPEQNAILAQPIEWPFPLLPYAGWSEHYPDTQERLSIIKRTTRYWFKWLEPSAV